MLFLVYEILGNIFITVSILSGEVLSSEKYSLYHR